jgi:hypothetical protein
MKCPLNDHKPCIGKDCFLYVPPEMAFVYNNFINPINPRKGKKKASCGLMFMQIAAIDYLQNASDKVFQDFVNITGKYLGYSGKKPASLEDLEATMKKLQYGVREILRQTPL